MDNDLQLAMQECDAAIAELRIVVDELVTALVHEGAAELPAASSLIQ